MKMKLADALAPKRGNKMSTMPAVEYDFTPNRIGTKSGTNHGTGYGTGTGGARRIPQTTKQKK